MRSARAWKYELLVLLLSMMVEDGMVSEWAAYSDVGVSTGSS